MGPRHRTATLLLVMLASGASPAAGQNAPAGRTIAVTIDDLPFVRFTTLADARDVTTRLLAHVRAHGMPAIGFVNEGKLGTPQQERARTALLEAWLEQGLELGNHTFSHLRLHDASLAAYQADILRGERVTRRLMQGHGRTLRYFRHPTLATGRDLATKAAALRFLGEHGYTVAPVTIDNDEWEYALAYDRARARADSTLMRRIGDDYIRYMGEIFEHFEALSHRLLGREPAQVLLIHANALNADRLGELGTMMTRRGYRYVPLEEALRDSAYALPDEYVRNNGPSWLERWAVTRGMDPGTYPSPPAWVREAGRLPTP